MLLRAPPFFLLLALVASMTTAATTAQPRATEWAALAARPALAHHSTIRYDRSTPITIEAEVVETDAASGAAPKAWSIEMSSPGVLTRNGWTKRTFNPGDEITLKVGPLRNGDASGIFMEAILADGKAMIYSTELPTE